jgi:hypothetical protein
MKHRIACTLAALAAGAVLFGGCSPGPTDTGEDRTAGDALQDTAITMRIQTSYLFSGHLNPFRIDVDTRDGEVTLHGVVPSDIHRDLAVAMARNADGVTKVSSELEVSAADDPLGAEGGDWVGAPDETIGEARPGASPEPRP